MDGRVRFVRLRTAVQAGALALMVGAAGWTVFASIQMQSRGSVIEAQQQKIAGLDRERRRLGGELAATRAYYSNAASEMSRQVVALQRLASARGSLESQLLSTQAQLAEVEATYQQTRRQSKDLNQQVAFLRDRLRNREVANHLLSTRLVETGSALAGAQEGRRRAIQERREREAQLRFLESDLQTTASLNQSVRMKLDTQRHEMMQIVEARELATTEVRRLSSQIAALNSDLDEAYRTNSSLRRRLAATSDALTQTHAHQVVAEQRGQSLARTVGSLEDRLDQVRKTQLELLGGIREKARKNIATLEATLSRTGISTASLLNATIRRSSGLGGPLVALDDDLANETEDSFEGLVSRLEAELLQWESMQTLMGHIPLTRPTMSGYVSSNYGKRRDPIAGRSAFHKGVDIAAPPRTPIFATAGGVVTFAGTRTAYGKMVEIDHGFGFVTRYAHLRKILVKKGQRVKFHEQVATMGSSGRSTGSHVHYEVLYEGKQTDPANFFEAGRYVFKIQNASD
ncbi:peptidoglycan DD-metalloendopeptidase family protein [Minwuia sp.]|uniref:peptidoglycan DD-metalloendopeptidase family protein n=1 Tax=Minwuia sp. TaxID=2493630 RepID=UPI003A8FC82A